MKLSMLFAVAAIAISIPLHAQEKKAPAAPATATAKIVNVTPDEAEKLIATGVTVIDLRTEDEFEHDHIKGAKNINALDADFEKNLGGLDHNKPVLVHCQSGRRSKAAIEAVFSKSKFPTVYHLSEGLSSWKKAGKPLEVTPTPAESGKLPDRLK
jgi:rhodanese-related sulfurtransferase